MSEQERVPDSIDAGTPNVARMYDFYLGGKDNYEVDREMARQVMRHVPDLPFIARENRAFLRRAVRACVDAGVRQFVDLGAGLPTQGNVHEIAQGAAPGSRVVYVDIDPVVLSHARALLMNVDGVTTIQGDVRRPDEILAHPELRDLIDFREPVAVLMVAVLHFVQDDDDPYGVVARLRAEMAPGSHLVISHITADKQTPTVRDAARIYDRASAAVRQRSQAEVTRFFEGMELIEPGVTTLSLWRPDADLGPPADADRQWALAGVGRMP
ncbi:SAM-dependent methyltransferase [Thermomonospora umbrina]|uniref:S-adenosyl methyltransferase n=1 Tax=Thermomonospora umbrina TaxID=111806 RepID=A0A3D9SYM8_9ACTN|nr:SAM-dependent methyltransferase [Thermomonospora umbrina]REE96721.1 S-adenosyl methyltransferase [Thermomonospora umbrina]